MPNTCVKTLDCKQGAIRSVKFNVDGNYCITCGSDKTVGLWNPVKTLLLKKYMGHGAEALDAQGSCDNSQIVSCSQDKSVIIWDVSTGQPVRRFKGSSGHAAQVTCVRFNEESTVAISGGVDGCVKCWDLKSKKNDPIQSLNEAKDSVTSIQVSDHEILTGCADGKIYRYDLRNGQLCIDDMGESVSCVNFTKDSQCILVSCSDNVMRLIDKDTGDLLEKYTSHSVGDFRIDNCLNNTDTLVLSGSTDGRIYMWNLVTGMLEQKLEHPECRNRVVSALTFHPSLDRLISSCGVKLFLWNDGNLDEEESSEDEMES